MYLPLILLCGLACGLIPLRQLLLWCSAAVGIVRHHPSENDWEGDLWRQPWIWGWAAPTVAFLARYISFDTGAGYSVLAGAMPAQSSRWVYFFGQITFTSYQEVVVQMYDRLLLTVPSLFLLAYAAGTLLRRSLPARPLPVTASARTAD